MWPSCGQLREAAEVLLQRIAAGRSVNAEELDFLAQTVVDAPVVAAAAAVLNASGAFKLARAIDLAGLLAELPLPEKSAGVKYGGKQSRWESGLELAGHVSGAR